jgi:peptide chain release factor subunit 1
MIREALAAGAVDRLLISESLRKNITDLSCDSCKHTWTETLDRHESMPSCTSCDSHKVSVIEERPLIDELIASATQSNTGVVYISVDTEEGAQLYEGFGGLAALLRYPMM